jgi:septal ring factor EnvC (AmiA/AmiB activator)
MSRFEDDSEYDPPDDREGSEDASPTVRELRVEIIRLEAQLDQLTASVREAVAETTEIRAQVRELERALRRLEARHRRNEKFLVLAWLMAVLALALSVCAFLAT